ncbi:hypothetical protein [Variovorax sp. dw_308]|nr:hypothetical protein [Variovorax sp. dw_308]
MNNLSPITKILTTTAVAWLLASSTQSRAPHQGAQQQGAAAR